MDGKERYKRFYEALKFLESFFYLFSFSYFKNRILFPVPYGSFDTWFIAREDEALFPRYKYHLHLIQKIVQRKETHSHELPPSSSILLFGRITTTYRSLLLPLEFKELEEHGWFFALKHF